MNLVLIGYRGTGKSSVARLLSRLLGMEVFGTDSRIVERAGMGIPEIVASKGWDHFRQIEEEVVQEASGSDDCIIDCGGGVVLRDANVKALSRNGAVFLLTAEPEEIVRRIRDCDERPSLSGDKSFTEEVVQVLQGREPLYRKAADHVISTTDKTPGETAELICRLFRTLTMQVGR